jgi:hypothetical protein
MGRIDRVTKGERPTLLEATKANEVIDTINALQNVTIEKADQDAVYVTSSGVKIYYEGGGDGSVDGTGIDSFLLALGIDGKKTYEVGIKDGLIDSFQETPNGVTLGTGGRYLMVDGTNHLQAKEFYLENGFVKSVISKPSSLQGVSSWIELQDPTDISRTIRLLIRNGLIAKVESGISRYEFTPMEVCVDGVNQTKNIITYNDNAEPQGLPAINDLLNEFYTKVESDAKFISINTGDARYMGILDAYTKQEADRIFVNGLNPPFYTKQKSLDLFLQKNEAVQNFVRKVDLAGDLNNLENNFKNDIQDAENRVKQDLVQNVQDLDQVDQQLQKNIIENKDGIEALENDIQGIEQTQENHNSRISDLENNPGDFYTKSEVDQIITDANSDLEDIGKTIQASNQSLVQIFKVLEVLTQEVQKQGQILTQIHSELEKS